MSTQPIDYDALAEQARKNAAAPVDYDALAAQVRNGSTQGLHPTPEHPDPNQPGMRPYQDPLQPLPVAEKAAATLDSMWEGIRNGAHAIPNLLQSIHDGQPSHEIEKRGVIRGSLEMIKKGFEQLNPIVPDKGQGPLNRAAESFGGVAGAAATADIVPGAEDVAAAKKVGAAVVDTAKKANPRGVMEQLTQGPQATVMPSAAKLPALAQAGAEKFFRAAAPTGMNKGFRENVNIAAPDLADIARKIDVSEAKGGVINPDMRVRATVDALREHQGEMYQQERAPQIQRNANAPVKIGTNENSIRGLEFLEATAGDVADSAIAKKALEERTLTVAEADKLAQLANKTLRSYEKMTPEGKMQLQATNPKIGGIKALDSELGNNLNDVLRSAGEEGLRDYERRYAAISVLRDQLESRMNASELERKISFPGSEMIKGAIKGKSGIASASQAAVADVNIGKMLQSGLKNLKDSGITAKRQPAPLGGK